MTHDETLLLAAKLTRRINFLADFLAVAREGSVRNAAAKIHISQPALTRRIQELEQDLGVDVFERNSRGMTLTRFGVVLRHHAEMVETTCSYAARELSELLEGGGGRLKVSAGPAWAYQLVPDAIADVQKSHPNVQVVLLSRLNDGALPLLLSGQLDLMLGGLPPTDEWSADLAYEPLMEVEHRVYAGTTHELHTMKDVGTDKLALSPWVWFSEAVSGRQLLSRLFERQGLVPPRSAVETSSIQCGFRLMSTSDYLMLLPSTLLLTALHHGVAPVNGVPPVGRYPAGLIYRRSALRLRAFLAFRQALHERVRQYSD